MPLVLVFAVLLVAAPLSAAELHPGGAPYQTAPIFGTNGDRLIAAWMENTRSSAGTPTTFYALLDDHGNALSSAQEPGWILGDKIASDGSGYVLLMRREDGSLDVVHVDEEARHVRTIKIETQFTIDAAAVWNGKTFVIVWTSLYRGLVSAHYAPSGEAFNLRLLDLQYEGKRGVYERLWMASSDDAILLVLYEVHFPNCVGTCFPITRHIAALLNSDGDPLARGVAPLSEPHAQEYGVCVASRGRNFIVGTLRDKRLEARIIEDTPPLRSRNLRPIGNQNYPQGEPQQCAAAWNGEAYMIASSYGPGANRYAMIETLSDELETLSVLTTPARTGNRSEPHAHRLNAFTTLIAAPRGGFLVGRSEGTTSSWKAVTLNTSDFEVPPPLPFAPLLIRTQATPGVMEVRWDAAAADRADGFVIEVGGTSGARHYVDATTRTFSLRIFDRQPPVAVYAFNASGYSATVPRRRQSVVR